MDPLSLPIDRFCNLVEHWWTRDMDAEKRKQFDTMLQRPVSGSTDQQVSQAVGTWSRDSELAEFKRSNR